MKKLLAITLLSLMILSSCGQQAIEVTGTYWTNPLSTTFESGLYFYDYFDGGRKSPLTYVDYNSLAKAVVCPKPNCKHDDEETCPALGFYSSPAVIPVGDKIYWFDSKNEFDDGKWTVQSTLMTAEKYGSDKKSVAVLKGLKARPDKLLIHGGKLWFIAEDVGLDEHGSTNEDYPYLYYYDFSSGKFQEVCNISEKELDGGTGYAEVIGFWDGGIIIDVISYEDESKHFQGKFDPQSGEIEKYDFFVDNVYGDYLLGHSDSYSTAIILSADNQKYTFTDLGEDGTFGSRIINKKLFCSIPKTVIDLETGKRYRLLKEHVMKYVNGEYITMVNKYDGNGTKFERYGEESVIGEELPV